MTYFTELTASHFSPSSQRALCGEGIRQRILQGGVLISRTSPCFHISLLTKILTWVHFLDLPGSKDGKQCCFVWNFHWQRFSPWPNFTRAPLNTFLNMTSTCWLQCLPLHHPVLAIILSSWFSQSSWYVFTISNGISYPFRWYMITLAFPQQESWSV